VVEWTAAAAAAAAPNRLAWPLQPAAGAAHARLRGLDPHTPWPRAAAAAAAAVKWRAVLKALGVTPCRPAGGQRDGNRG
jgi:hypothetical protein